MKKSRTTHLLIGDDAGVYDAVARLKKGQLVALPTETVYGLGARADDPSAVRAIFEAKGRPADHPLIVHVGDIAQFGEWASEISDCVLRLAEAFCPGPLTFILPLKADRDRTVTGGQAYVGLRIPSHPLTLRVLQESRLGIAAPSANRFGRISPTSAADVLEELNGQIDAVLDGGVCEVGIESTIIKVDADYIHLLRPGHIGIEAIESVAQRTVRVSEPIKLRVSGCLESHYAPLKPAYRVPFDRLERLAQQWNASDWVVSHVSLPTYVAERQVQVKALPNVPEAYAHEFYAALRQGDALSHIERLWVIEPFNTPEWMAVRDRLMRATQLVADLSIKNG